MIWVQIGDYQCHRPGELPTGMDSGKPRLACLDSTGEISESFSEENANTTITLSHNSRILSALKTPPLRAHIMEDDSEVFSGSIERIRVADNITISVSA